MALHQPIFVSDEADQDQVEQGQQNETNPMRLGVPVDLVGDE